MWEVLSFGDKPYGEMSNQEVSPGQFSPHHPSVASHPFPKSSCKYLYFFFLIHSFSVLLSVLVTLAHTLCTTPTMVRGLRGSIAMILGEQRFLTGRQVSFLPQASFPSLLLQVMKSIEDGYRLPPPVDCPAPLYELMKNCWAYDRARRPHFHQLKAHLDHLLANPHSLRTIANFDPRSHWGGQIWENGNGPHSQFSHIHQVLGLGASI